LGVDLKVWGSATLAVLMWPPVFEGRQVISIRSATKHCKEPKGYAGNRIKPPFLAPPIRVSSRVLMLITSRHA